jgi:prolyl oligopeptidase
VPKKLIALCLLLGTASALFAASAAPPAKPVYPPSPIRTVTDDYFVTKVEDPYRWLERGDDPEVVAWTEAQNELVPFFQPTVSLELGDVVTE